MTRSKKMQSIIDAHQDDKGSTNTPAGRLTFEVKGSRWESGEDDHWHGGDSHHATVKAAVAAAREAISFGDRNSWICILNSKGVMVHEEHNGDAKQREAWDAEALRDEEDWAREQATMAGMAFGCEGYNDAMGY